MCLPLGHRCDSTLAAMCGLVGQDSVGVTVAQAGLVKAHVFAEVLRVKDVLVSGIENLLLGQIDVEASIGLAEVIHIEVVYQDIGKDGTEEGV